MSNETREIRGYVPVAVAERLEHAAEVLGISIRHLAGECMVASLEDVVCEKARYRAAQLASLLPADAGDSTIVVVEDDNGAAPAPRKPGRAERQAAARAEELKEQRRRQRSSAKTVRDPVD